MQKKYIVTGKCKLFSSLDYSRLSNEDNSSIGDNSNPLAIPFEEPAPKKYRCTVTSSTGQQDDVHDVYYCMNVVIESRAFQMNQEIVEGRLYFIKIDFYEKFNTS